MLVDLSTKNSLARPSFCSQLHSRRTHHRRRVASKQGARERQVNATVLYGDNWGGTLFENRCFLPSSIPLLPQTCATVASSAGGYMLVVLAHGNTESVEQFKRNTKFAHAWCTCNWRVALQHGWPRSAIDESVYIDERVLHCLQGCSLVCRTCHSFGRLPPGRAGRLAGRVYPTCLPAPCCGCSPS